MPLPAGTHPDHGCHHEFHEGGHVFHACEQFWMQPIEVVALPESHEPPIDLIVAMEQKLRAEAAARRARKRNRQAGAS